MRTVTGITLAVLLVLAQGGAAQAQQAAPLSVGDVGTVAVDLPVFGSGEATIPVRLREVSGHPADLAPPVLLSLIRDSGGGPVAVTPCPVTVSRDGAPVSGGVHLAAFERVEFTVRVTCLTGAGTYTAQLAVDTTSGVELTAPATVKARASIWLAIGLIVLGVALSAVLRYLIGRYRDDLRSRRAIALLGLRLQEAQRGWGALDPARQAIADDVAGQVAELRMRQQAGDRPTEPQVEECGRKIPGLQSYLKCAARVGDNAELADRLTSVERWLTAPVDDPDIATLRQTARTALTEVANGLTALASPLGQRITRFQQVVADALAAAEQTGAQDRITDFRAAGEKARQARELLVSDPEQAQQRFDEATALAGKYGLAMGGEATAETAEPIRPGEPVRVDVTDPLAGLGRRERAADLTVTVVVGAVAVVLGLQLLYVNQLAWGSSLDLVAAALWGLGLHPVGGTVFSGLDSLREQIAPTPSKE